MIVLIVGAGRMLLYIMGFLNSLIKGIILLNEDLLVVRSIRMNLLD